MNQLLATYQYGGSGSDVQLQTLINVVDRRAAEQSLGASRLSSEWADCQDTIRYLTLPGKDGSLPLLIRLIESLDMYSPALLGLQAVHGFVVDILEELTFRCDASSAVAAYLYGQCLAMTSSTHDRVQQALDDSRLRKASELFLCFNLGIKRSNESLFENNLVNLMPCIQASAFSLDSTAITQDALHHAMRFYNGPSEQSRHIVASTRALFAASLRLAAMGDERGLLWSCFMISNTPMLLRNQLRTQFDIQADDILQILALHFKSGKPEHIQALCAALPILITWETSRFCDEGQVTHSIAYLLSLPPSPDNFRGIGQIASIILDRFSPYLSQVGQLGLTHLKDQTRAAQLLLTDLLISLGPCTNDIMSTYLQCPTEILLGDVQLLELISALLPPLAGRITIGLCSVIDRVVEGDDTLLEPILAALTAFPLSDPALAAKSRTLVQWTMNEDKSQAAILYALQLAVDPYIATADCIHSLSHKAAHLLLAEDPHIVHMALSALSNPLLAAVLDEKCCEMILLALHQSLEPSVQIVAAKLLTHLSTPHRGIIQPLAWNHIRQSLGLIEFLQTLDPSRAIVEACVISNLLASLPVHVRRPYIRSIKDLILVGLERPQDSQTLSLIFQGLANLARFDAWGQSQQMQLAIDLLEMSQEIPRDSQHAALNAIARLLATPQGDAYEMLGSVHTSFKRNSNLDPDLKALVSGIYGTLGTVERNPIISRDSKAAILREKAVYTNRIQDLQAAQVEQHVGTEWLVTTTLQSMLSTTKGDARSALIESLTAVAVLQTGRTEQLVPNLPTILMRQINESSIKSSLVLLAATLHASTKWLQCEWPNLYRTMTACMEQDVRTVFQGVDLVLDKM